MTVEQRQHYVEALGAEASTDDWVTTLSEHGYDHEYLKSLADAAVSYVNEGYEPPALEATTPVAQAAPEPEVVQLKGNMPDFEALKSADEAALKGALKGLIGLCVEQGASDLHITAGARPRIRLHRQIQYISDRIIGTELAERLNKVFLTQEQRATFEKEMDFDYALCFEENESQRYRVNLMTHKDGVSGVYHIVPSRVKTLDELGFTNSGVIKSLLSYHNGIVLVTGPVGSGKTATLSTLVSELNATRTDHIVTVEDPIEVVQNSVNCIITQREVGKHTESFATALKSALREDPDVIVIGEMRDLETIEMAITAAETGHLVIATMHTRDAATTLSRLLDVFPPAQQNQIRAMAAGSLRGILCQRLLPSTDGKLVLASELLINTPAVANLVREGKEQGLKSVMQVGKSKGMQIMNDTLMDLVRSGKVTKETAIANISDKSVQRAVKVM